MTATEWQRTARWHNSVASGTPTSCTGEVASPAETEVATQDATEVPSPVTSEPTQVPSEPTQVPSPVPTHGQGPVTSDSH
eukprot:3819892-Heterocapsa_arctica.AAC.1